MKLALGTVQFGLDYGVNNTQGQISYREAVSIVKYAKERGISLIDTAIAYGSSEEVLGKVFGELNTRFNMVTKIPHTNATDVEGLVEGSLQRLAIGQLYGCLLHDIRNLESQPDVWYALQRLKERGVLQKIGVSVYRPEELESLWENGYMPDLVQVPYSILDQRFKPLFRRLKENNTEIHTRSVFLQGLFFKHIQELPVHFSSVADRLAEIRDIADQHHISLLALLLGFALLAEEIDHVVVGVDSLSQLAQIVEAVQQQNHVRQLKLNWDRLAVTDESIVIPSNWKLR